MIQSLAVVIDAMVILSFCGNSSQKFHLSNKRNLRKENVCVVLKPWSFQKRIAFFVSSTTVSCFLQRYIEKRLSFVYPMHHAVKW